MKTAMMITFAIIKAMNTSSLVKRAVVLIFHINLRFLAYDLALI